MKKNENLLTKEQKRAAKLHELATKYGVSVIPAIQPPDESKQSDDFENTPEFQKFAENHLGYIYTDPVKN